MNENATATAYYFCPVCFDLVDASIELHPHRLVRIYPGAPGSERRKPVHSSNGDIQSRAPLWFLEALHLARQEAASA
jgi:hypothetical protein